MATFDRDWFRAQLTSYLKDDSLDIELDTFLDLAAKRVSQVLRCFEMELQLTLGLAPLQDGVLDGGFASVNTEGVVDGGDAFASSFDATRPYMEIPGGLIAILSVQALGTNDTFYNLRSVGMHEANKWRKETGRAQVYVVENSNIYPYPFSEGSYKARILQEVEFPLQGNEVPAAITAYPFIFLDAALAEAYDWKQDEIMSQKYMQKWVAEAQTVRDNWENENAGEALAVRAV